MARRQVHEDREPFTDVVEVEPEDVPMDGNGLGSRYAPRLGRTRASP